jgi:hypothetical protein
MNNNWKWTPELVSELYNWMEETDPASFITMSTHMECFKKYKESKELKWFVIPSTQSSQSEVAGWTPYKQHIGDMGGYGNCKYFDTEEDASLFIIKNKPCLSLSEINDLLVKKTGYGIGVDIIRDLKELVKSKL